MKNLTMVLCSLLMMFKVSAKESIKDPFTGCNQYLFFLNDLSGPNDLAVNNLTPKDKINELEKVLRKLTDVYDNHSHDINNWKTNKKLSLHNILIVEPTKKNIQQFTTLLTSKAEHKTRGCFILGISGGIVLFNNMRSSQEIDRTNSKHFLINQLPFAALIVSGVSCPMTSINRWEKVSDINKNTLFYAIEEVKKQITLEMPYTNSGRAW